MICCKCERNLIRCICDDADARIEKLTTCKYLAIDWNAFKARRFLAKHEIDADRLAWQAAEAARREAAATEADDGMPEELGVAGVEMEGGDDED